MAAVQIRPATLAGPRFAAGTPLRVESERLTLRCAERDDEPACAFEATYRVRNPGAEPSAVAGAFYGRKGMTRDVVIRSGGRELGAPLDPEAGAALDASIGVGDDARGMRGVRRRIGAKEDAERWGFRLEVAAGETLELTATGLLHGGRRFVPSMYAIAPVEARHLGMSASVEPKVNDLEYWLSPLATWSGEPSVEVELRFPAGWGFDAEGWTVTSDGGERIARQTARPAGGELTLSFTRPAPRFFRGGPILAIAGSTGDQSGCRLRGGWEVAAPEWLLFSAAAEWGWKDRLYVVPMVKAASRMILFIPSFGVGLGLPVQLLPERRTGVRLELDAMLGPLGFVASFDWYPGSPALASQTWGIAFSY
jgi:hypothetical protein